MGLDFTALIHYAGPSGGVSEAITRLRGAAKKTVHSQRSSLVASATISPSQIVLPNQPFGAPPPTTISDCRRGPFFPPWKRAWSCRRVSRLPLAAIPSAPYHTLRWLFFLT